MRGLRLFVRPIEPSDHTAVCAFLEREAGNERADCADGPQPEGTATTPAWGLLGKLLGEIVAVVAVDIRDGELRIADVVVASAFRKKRIGRAMLREVEQLATRMDRNRIVVEDAGGAAEFFRRVGFRSEGERWVRVVS